MSSTRVQKIVEHGVGSRAPDFPEDSNSARLQEARARLLERPGFLLRRCQQHITGVFEQACGDLGMTARQYDYLFVLEIMGEAGQGEIAETLGLDKSTNALVLKILERKKWIARKVVKADTRRRLVRVTPAGRAAFDHARQAAEGAVACITGAVTRREYDSLVAILQKVVAANTAAEAGSNQG